MNEKQNIIKRGYRATRNFLFSRKSPNENVMQYIFRQFLFPDSRGKPSLTATFFIWIMVIITYLTINAITLAFKMNVIMTPTTESRTMVGFSDSLIYLYITIVGFLGYMFHKREAREANTPAAPNGIIGAVIEKAKQFMGGNSTSAAPAPVTPAPQEQKILPPETP